ALAIGVLFMASSSAPAARSHRRSEYATIWAAAPTAMNVVAAAPAVTSPVLVVTAFSLLLVAIVIRIVSIQRNQRLILSRFGGLYGP
ncbi:MAG TPA: hypothetical protein VGM03_12685, partial [Phycisphaerae bacterium]